MNWTNQSTNRAWQLLAVTILTAGMATVARSASAQPALSGTITQVVRRNGPPPRNFTESGNLTVAIKAVVNPDGTLTILSAVGTWTDSFSSGTACNDEIINRTETSRASSTFSGGEYQGLITDAFGTLSLLGDEVITSTGFHPRNGCLGATVTTTYGPNAFVDPSGLRGTLVYVNGKFDGIDFTGDNGAGTVTSGRLNIVERRPVLIIPGVGGTYSADVSSDLTWLIHRGVPPSQLQIDPMTKVYDDLIQTLKNVGYVEGKDLFIVNYDWRLPPGPDDGVIDGQISGLTAASISNQHYRYAVDYFGDILKQSSERWAIDHSDQPPLDSVDVITHSTGGLVARTYIQSAAYGGDYSSGKTLPKINNLFMIGVPNQGASKAWNPLHDNWGVDPAFQMVLSKIINRAYQKVLNNRLVISGPDYNISLASITAPQCQDLPEICFINQYVPTARALLATYDFIDFGSGLTSVNSLPGARNSLLLDLNAGDPNAFADLVTAKPTIIYGTNGDDTPTTVVEEVGPTFTPPGFAHPIADFANFIGRDAGPGEVYYSDNRVPNGGDGTVPLISSVGQFIGDSRVTLKPFTKGGAFTLGNTFGDVAHTALPYNTSVQQAILDTLGVSCVAPGCNISFGKNSLGAGAATACAAGCSNFGLDPVDGFMVDAQGRRLGFSAATGPLTEIPGSVWFGNSEGMGWVFGPVEEPVRLQLSGLGQNYYADATVLSTGRVGAVSAGGFLGLGAPKSIPIPVTAIGDSTADTTPPALSGLSADLTFESASPNGTFVTWTRPTALDAIDGAVPVVCAPESGSGFPLGMSPVACSAVDSHGNRVTGQFTVTIQDTTPPAIAPLITGPIGANGWYVGAVRVDWSLTDPGSLISSSEGCEPGLATSDSAALTITCRATSAGGTASRSVTVKIDRTPPSIAGLRSPVANGNGWNNGPVTITFQCSDALSGLAAGSPPSPAVVSIQRAGQSVNGACTDVAGNSASLTVANINIDRTAPQITVAASSPSLWPPNGKLVRDVFSGTVTDALSGIDPTSATFRVIDEYGKIQPSGAVTVASDGRYSFTVPLEASRLGQDSDGRHYQVIVSARDKAGNSSSASAIVTVPHHKGK